MINHKFKCIFIHIPCAGGTSIENWICGKDYWNIDNKEKHLLSCQAKEMYAEYWDEYFKFSIVRNPYRRTVSMLKDPSFFGVTIDEGNLDFTNRMKHLQKNKIYPTINNFVETNSIYQRDFTEYNYEPRL
jgi:hypothetical protein